MQLTLTLAGFAALLVHQSTARISVMYAHDKFSDLVAHQCLNEMFPKAKVVLLQESDEPCIYFCILKKLGIISNAGTINLDAFRQRILMTQHMETIASVNNLGANCVERAEATPHKQDVCKKAKIFNDCTKLYKIVLR